MRLQFVLGSHSASIHPATNASNWTVEGQVGRRRGRGLEGNSEKKEGESRRKRSVRGRGLMGCKGCRGRPGKWEGC